jgi:hypothetical protein
MTSPHHLRNIERREAGSASDSERCWRLPEEALRVVEVDVRTLCCGAFEHSFALQKRALPPFVELRRKRRK